jgi:hypothetical protein
MRAGLEKNLDDPSTGNALGIMRNFNQKSRHRIKPPLTDIFLRNGPLNGAPGVARWV